MRGFATLTIFAILERRLCRSYGAHGFATLTIFAILEHRIENILTADSFATLTIFAILELVNHLILEGSVLLPSQFLLY